MPMRSMLQPDPAVRRATTADAESVVERLFDLSMDIAGAEPGDAAEHALSVVLEFVDCEAAVIFRGSPNDFEFKLLAASGAYAELVGRTVGVLLGLAGACLDAGGPIQVPDAAADPRHYAAFDVELGFASQETLCVAVACDDDVFGVIQVANPKSPLTDDEVEIVQTIGRTLAAALAARD